MYKLNYHGPFSRYAFILTPAGVDIFDAESASPGSAIVTVPDESAARSLIDSLVAADPSMRELGEEEHHA